jgi:chaperone modulatory protein CbpM
VTDPNAPALAGPVVEECVHFSLFELCRACRADTDEVLMLVDAGVLEPMGSEPADWRFGGASLRRAHVALRLARDLGIEPSGLALVLDLLDEIDSLRRRLHAAGILEG